MSARTIALIGCGRWGRHILRDLVTHADVIEDLLPLGCPIFVEKPLASSVERARAVVAQGGERIFVMDKWRYHPGVVRLAALAGLQ